MLESLITSKTRIKLLVKFFINSQTTGYLRNLASEFGESTNAIRLELNRFEEAGLLAAQKDGNRKYYKANTQHPFFKDINRMLMKHVGIDSIIDNVIEKVGKLEKAFITGDMARGIQSNIVDLILVADEVDYNYLNQLVKKAEEMVSFKIRYMVVAINELSDYLKQTNDYILVWSNN